MTGQKDLKITFIGDIMCEKPLLKGAYREGGRFDFSPLFSAVKDKFGESSYVVGNLETVCAGQTAGYTDQVYSFNSPDSLIQAISEAGINLVTTANNHCLDRGLDGLKRTLDLLDQQGLEHTGTFRSEAEREKILVKDFEGFKVAFLAYTYGTNTRLNQELLGRGEEYAVNRLQCQAAEAGQGQANSLKARIAGPVLKRLSLERWLKFKQLTGFKPPRPSVDDSLEALDGSFLEQLQADLKRAGKVANYTICCLHSGGQFNLEPGRFSHHIFDFLAKNGADLVVGTHPHVVQRHDLFAGSMLGFYSLGSFNISPSSPYLVKAGLPCYSVMLHLYFKQKVLSKVTFTVLKAVEDKRGMLVIYPVNLLGHELVQGREISRLVEDVTFIYNRIMAGAKKKVKLQDEYLLWPGEFLINDDR